MARRYTGSFCALVGAVSFAGLTVLTGCETDDTPSSSSGAIVADASAVTPQGPCDGKPVNACGGCATLSAKPGDLCGPGQYVVCKGSDATECKAGDGPPVSGLVATTNLEDKVTLSWTAPASLQPASYIILRDGAEWASTGVTKYDDESAEAAKVTAPSAVQASDGTAVDKVTVTWTPAASTPGKSYKYQVVGLYVQNGSTLKGLPSSEATGNRAAPPITGYEVQRDDGAWVPAGTGASFDDRLAPIGTLIGGNISSGALSRGPSAVVFGVVVEGQPAFTDAPPAKYTVRALTPAGNVVAATSDTGFRKKPVYEASKTTIKWQRSTVDADGSYVDLPGQTFAAGVDLTGPTDGSGRYYRPVVLFDGAPFPSTGTRATASAFKSVELFWDAGCGIRLDDTVTCWGNNNGNMVQGVPPGLKAKKVAVGSSHACAIRTDDTAVCWGSAADGRTTVPSGAIKDIAASDVGNCVVKSDNTLACNGAIGGSAAPAGAFKRVYRGVSAFCATKADDTTACWGIDNGGVVTNAPVAVKFKALAGGESHFCGITDADKLRCWGASDQAPFLSTRSPFNGAPSTDSYKALSVGFDNTCATRTDDTLECWGTGEEGHFVGRSSLKFKSLANGNRMACGVDMTDRFFCAASRNYNQVGPNEVAPILPAAGFKAPVAAGRDSVICGITDAGKVECYGGAYRSDSVRAVSPSTVFKSAESGPDYGCGLRADDTLECWGNRGNAPASTVTKYAHYSVSWSGSTEGGNTRGVCAIRQDNGAMECFNGPTALVGTFKQVAVSRGWVCGINASNNVVCGSYQANYNVTAPTGTFKSISAGRRRTNFCGITTADKRICWGVNDTGGTNTLSADSFTNVTNSSEGACSLLADGRRSCLGTRFGTGESFDKFLALSVGRESACSVRTDKLFYCDAGNANAPRLFGSRNINPD